MFTCAPQIRVLKSIVIQTYGCVSDHPVVTAVLEARSKFGEASKQLRTNGSTPDAIREKLGMPSVHAFNALIQATIEMLNRSKAGTAAKLKEMLEKFLAAWQTHGWKGIIWYIKHVAISNMFHANLKRLEISAPQVGHHPFGQLSPNPQDVLNEVKQFLVHADSHTAPILELAGMVPKGDLEQKIQAALDGDSSMGSSDGWTASATCSRSSRAPRSRRCRVSRVLAACLSKGRGCP